MTWKDRLWQLTLVVVGAGVLGVCSSGVNNSSSGSSGGSGGGVGIVSDVWAFKPADINAYLICEYGYYDVAISKWQFTKCFSSDGSVDSSAAISLNFINDKGFKLVGTWCAGPSGNCPLFMK